MPVKREPVPWKFLKGPFETSRAQQRPYVLAQRRQARKQRRALFGKRGFPLLGDHAKRLNAIAKAEAAKRDARRALKAAA